MAAYKDCSGFFYLIRAPCQNISQYGRIQTIGKAYNIEGYRRLAAHSPDIAERVGCRNLSEHIGIIHDRSKEVHRLDHGNLIRNLIDSRVIGGLNPHDQIIIMEFWQLAQNLGKGLGTNLSCSSGCLAKCSQSDI